MGAIGAIGAIGNAVNDALAPLGVQAVQQPFSPEYLRSLMHNPRGGSGLISVQTFTV
jgi:CO/xanthine dehydrogenase Mo-binding subunit